MEDQAPPFDLLPNQNPINDRKDLFNKSKKQEGGEKERKKKYIMVTKNLQTLEQNQHHDKIKHSIEELQPINRGHKELIGLLW